MVTTKKIPTLSLEKIARDLKELGVTYRNRRLIIHPRSFHFVTANAMQHFQSTVVLQLDPKRYRFLGLKGLRGGIEIVLGEILN